MPSKHLKPIHTKAHEAIRLAKLGFFKKAHAQYLAARSGDHDHGTVVDVFRRAMLAELMRTGLRGDRAACTQYMRLLEFSRRCLWTGKQAKHYDKFVEMFHEQAVKLAYECLVTGDRGKYTELQKMVAMTRPRGVSAKVARLSFMSEVEGRPMLTHPKRGSMLSPAARTALYLSSS